jgi:N-acetylmuramoyl-L-alanine amidase
VLGGYADGFHPNDNVTRGQAAKIISNAAGYADAIPAATQTFVDVPHSSAFWLYVERVYKHDAISGYACGGAGEPCPGLYFRPGANLTRGQLAKITTSVAGYSETLSGQSFSDVPPASPFYQYIGRAKLHNVISGYACGGPGEPCPGSYFRPGNNVTRGQTAKIVAGTFFPDCPVAP